jgi:hypothetical protein
LLGIIILVLDGSDKRVTDYDLIISWFWIQIIQRNIPAWLSWSWYLLIIKGENYVLNLHQMPLNRFIIKIQTTSSTIAASCRRTKSVVKLALIRSFGNQFFCSLFN